jgi:hypothetical protein
MGLSSAIALLQERERPISAGLVVGFVARRSDPCKHIQVKVNVDGGDRKPVAPTNKSVNRATAPVKIINHPFRPSSSWRLMARKL